MTVMFIGDEKEKAARSTHPHRRGSSAIEGGNSFTITGGNGRERGKSGRFAPPWERSRASPVRVEAGDGGEAQGAEGRP